MENLWMIEEHGLDHPRQLVRESQFALGNGYIGARSALEECPDGARPGTYLAGVYDRIGAQVAELVNFPNPFRLVLTIDGEKMGPGTMEIVTHRRRLDMRSGTLQRETVFRDRLDRRYRYESVRFLSMVHPTVAAHRVSVTALDKSCGADVRAGIDLSSGNHGPASEGVKCHYRVAAAEYLGGGLSFLSLETLEKRRSVTYWSKFDHKSGGSRRRGVESDFTFKLTREKPVVFTRITSIEHWGTPAPENAGRDSFDAAVKRGFDRLLKDHERAWETIWKRADVRLEAPAELQRGLRFSLYHMLICGTADGGFSSIGAKTLSGEGYRGHVFWDTEIFLLPFFAFTFPDVAASLLQYRYRRLPAARQLARKEGYRGARFPWESADAGGEETPSWGRGPDGSLHAIHTHEFEHHIVADIAYAVWQYWQISGDRAFMRDYGCELIFETARFWASRVRHDRDEERYVIDHVIGPDEYHVDVNNNAFTNAMAAWNLDLAARLYRGECSPLKPLRKVLAKLKLDTGEVDGWSAVSEALHMVVGADAIIEQFEEYFDLEDVVLEVTGENGLPVIAPRVGTMDWQQTTLLKQADVVMLLCLLDERFDGRIKRANYDFYTPRTTHHSSLSPAMHAILAGRIGYTGEADRFFDTAVRMDIDDVNGNTTDGIHAACLGGAWQAAVFGYGGVTVRGGDLYIDPRLSERVRAVQCTLVWRGHELQCDIGNKTVDVTCPSSSGAEIPFRVFGRREVLQPGKRHIFSRAGKRKVQDI